jgi:hypothetical protein
MFEKTEWQGPQRPGAQRCVLGGALWRAACGSRLQRYKHNKSIFTEQNKINFKRAALFSLNLNKTMSDCNQFSSLFSCENICKNYTSNSVVKRADRHIYFLIHANVGNNKRAVEL